MYHCSTFSVAFLRDLYGSAGVICPRAVFCRQRQYLESSLQRVQVRLHRILIRPAFSFMSLRAMRYQPWVAGLVYRSYQFFDMAAINNILRWELIEVTPAFIFRNCLLTLFLRKQAVPARRPEIACL